MGPRIIGHVDMDAFFAAVEERDTPRFAGQPLVVGADPQGGQGRGVVSTANYPARGYGIHSAMPIRTAWRLAEAARQQGKPPAIFVSGNWRRYSEVSEQVMALIATWASAMLQVGVDEAYCDFTSAGSYAAARGRAGEIQSALYDTLGLSASIGIGPNKLVAKVASDCHKPGGLTVVTPEETVAFLASLPVRALPGVGPKSEQLLARWGIRSVADVQGVSADQLQKLLGVHGESLHRKARGEGSVSLTPAGPAKSIGEQTTLPQDTLRPVEILPRLVAMCDSVHEQLLADSWQGWRTVTVTVRFSSFVTRTRSRTFGTQQRSRQHLTHAALQLLLPFFDHRENPHHQPLRLVGVRVGKLG